MFLGPEKQGRMLRLLEGKINDIKDVFCLVFFSVGEKSYSACFLHWLFLVAGSLSFAQGVVAGGWWLIHTT